MAAKTLAKPQLRGLLETNIKKALIGAIICSIGSGIAWHFLVSVPRKQAYADFYKTYDPIKHMNIMCDAGIMTSCKPGQRDFQI